MSHRNLKGLLVLNGLLVAVLAAITFAPSADAQSQRFRGKYTMVSGRSQGTTPYLLYILNQNSRELVAVRYNVQQSMLEGMAYADLAKDSVTVQQNSK